MYATIRKYRIKSGEKEKVNRLVKDGFLPLISKVSGFVDYYGLDAGGEFWASVSIFDSKAGAEESNRLAADWARKNIGSLLVGSVEIIAGDVVAHKVGELMGRKAA